MSEISAIGMVIYTYDALEARADGLWEWLQSVEAWAGRRYAEFHFSPRAKESFRIWKASAKNWAQLRDRLQTEQPWLSVDFGCPDGTLKQGVSSTRGVYVSLLSAARPLRGMERYRRPSYVYVETHPEVLLGSASGVAGFIALGRQAWELVTGDYGFIDLEVGIPLQDSIHRNVAHLLDSTVPAEHFEEFRHWQQLMPVLNKRLWKAFWGNFLSAEHVQQLGGIEEMRRAEPRRRLLPEFLDSAYRKGLERLRACKCYAEWHELANGGAALLLSSSPLDWYDPYVQERRDTLQAILEPIALHADSNSYT